MTKQRYPSAWRSLLDWQRAVFSPHSQLDRTTKLVLAALATHANPALRCFPSQATIAAECAITERAARTHLKAAEAAGWILRGRTKRARTRNFRHDYQLVIPTAYTERRSGYQMPPIPEPNAAICGTATPDMGKPVPLNSYQEVLHEIKRIAKGGREQDAKPDDGEVTAERLSLRLGDQEVGEVFRSAVRSIGVFEANRAVATVYSQTPEPTPDILKHALRAAGGLPA